FQPLHGRARLARPVRPAQIRGETPAPRESGGTHEKLPCTHLLVAKGQYLHGGIAGLPRSDRPLARRSPAGRTARNASATGGSRTAPSPSLGKAFLLAEAGGPRPCRSQAGIREGKVPDPVGMGDAVSWHRSSLDDESGSLTSEARTEGRGPL